MTKPTHPVIAIIGGGFSGTLFAAQLLRLARIPLAIKLIERSPHQLHRGIAYSSNSASHLLNVPAGKMSAFPDQPEHFLKWAQRNAQQLIDPPWLNEIDAKSFVSRRCYGEYLNWIINDSYRLNSHRLSLEKIDAEATAIQPDGDGILLSLQDGSVMPADKVILAVGNFPPADPKPSAQSLKDQQQYIANPWQDASSVSWEGIESCLIVGAGLTMVDWVLKLREQNFQGKIHVVSRRGLLPKAHADYQELPFWIDLNQKPLSVRSLFRQFRSLLAQSVPHHDNWRGLIDALRPRSAEIWQALSLTEQHRFLRHLRPYWDNHRHRLAPQTYAALKAIEDSEQLEFHSGRIEAIDDNDGKLEVRIRAKRQGLLKTLSVDRIMNCTGTECDYRKLQDPLLRNLLSQGLAKTDNISFGLAVAEDGGLLDKSGRKSSLIYTLGPPKKGSLWETTAVPEIRGQAQALASTLLAELDNKTLI
jgi:uncharacterized NAD(P)/FAD-binding protein YdhS